MSPFVDVVIMVLTMLFILISLAPLLTDASDVAGIDENKSQVDVGGMTVQDLMNLEK
jgi:hypothetical protein